MEINNKEAHKLVQIFGVLGCIPGGSYSRDSKQLIFTDLDFLTFRNLSDLTKDVKNLFGNHVIVSKSGLKYVVFIIDGKHIDVWKTTKLTFWEDYSRRSIKKEKLIYINKFLKNN